MRYIWSLGGLSGRDLLIRTVRESWEDNVFGQAARLGFYHFLAIFPSLLLLFLVARPAYGPESSLQNALARSIEYLLPAAAAALMSGTVSDLHRSALEASGIWAAALGGLWASVNGAWAVIDGINAAYEVSEKRSFVRVLGVSLLFTVLVAGMTLAALAGGQFAAASLKAAGLPALAALSRWIVMTAALFVCLVVFYRLGPSIEDREWQWSTPGAIAAAALWIGGTLAYRYWTNSFSNNTRIYGRLGAVVSLLIWLYFTGATVLIGAEMDSEIEKAAMERHGQRRKGVQRVRN